MAQLVACAPPGLTLGRVAAAAAFPVRTSARGHGPHRNIACITGLNQDEPTSSREAVRKFQARFQYALRQLRKDAPSVAARCRLSFDDAEGKNVKSMTNVEGLRGAELQNDVVSSSNGQGIATGTTYFDMSSQDGQDDDGALASRVEQRLDDIQDNIRELTIAIVNCPVLIGGKGHHEFPTQGDDSNSASETEVLTDQTATVQFASTAENVDLETQSEMKLPTGGNELLANVEAFIEVDGHAKLGPVQFLEKSAPTDTKGKSQSKMVKAKPPVEAASLRDAAEFELAVAGIELPTGSDGETTSNESVKSALIVPCDSVAELRTGTVQKHVYDQEHVSQWDKTHSDSVAEFRLGEMSAGHASCCDAKLDTVARYQLDQSLDAIIGKHRLGLVCSDLEREALAPIAQDRLKWRLECRQMCRENCETADKSNVADACDEWLRNEAAIDDVWYCFLDSKCHDPARDRVMLGRIRKMIPALRKKPALLKTLMKDLEKLHPWSRALANAVAAAIDEL